MLDYTGDKIANEIKELRYVLQDIRNLLIADNNRKSKLQESEVELFIDRSVFDNEHLLRSEKPI